MNSLVLVVNDALPQIRSDASFGQTLAQEIERFAAHGGINGPESRPLHVPAGNHANAAAVITTFHADTGVVAYAGGNTGIVAGHRHGAWRFQEDEVKLHLLTVAAHKLGYRLVKDQA